MNGTDMPAVPAQGSEPRAPRKRPRWVRALLWFLLVLVALIVLAVAGLLVALRTETGSRELWGLAGRLTGGALTGQFEGGTFANGVRLRDVAFVRGDTRIDVTSIDGNWALAWRLGPGGARLHVAWLRIGEVQVNLPPAVDEPDDKPATMPQSLELPLTVDVDSLTLQRLTLRRGLLATPATDPMVEITDLAASLHSDGERHRLSLANVGTPYGKLSANAQLGGAAPFPLNAEALLEGSWQKESFSLSARAAGNLESLRADLEATGERIRARGEADVTPFGTVPFTRLVLRGDRIDPRLFSPSAPQANLSVQADLRPVRPAAAPAPAPAPASAPAASAPAASVPAASAPPGGAAPGGAAPPAAAPLTVAGPISITNSEAGAIDTGRLPVTTIEASVELNASAQHVRELRIGLSGDGEIAGSGSLRDGHGGFDLDVRRVDPHALHGALRPMRLSGPVIVRLEPGRQSVALDIGGGPLKLFADARIDAEAVTLAALRVGLADGSVQAEGRLGLKEQQPFAFKGRIANLDPSRLADVARGRINASFDANGTLAEVIRAALDFSIGDSEYAGLPMTGGGKVRVAGKRLLPSEATLSMAGNRADVRGSFGAPGDRLRVAVDAPQLDRLRFGVSGALKLDGDVAGTIERPEVTATYSASALAFGEHRLASANGSAELRGGLDGPLRFRLDASGYRGPQMGMRTLSARLDGTQANHTFEASGEGRMRGNPLQLAVAGQGSWQGERWSGTLRTLQETGTFDLRLAQPVTVTAAAQQLVLGATRLTFGPGTITIGALDWNRGRIRSNGAIDGLRVAHLLQIMETVTGDAPPVRSDLVLDGNWNLNLAETASGFAELRRRGGDLSVNAGRGFTTLGLGQTVLRADIAGGRIQLRGNVESSRIGSVRVDTFAGLTPTQGVQSVTPASAIGGRVVLDVPKLAAVETLTGPQYGLEGRLAATLDLAGTVGAPLLTGAVSGDDLGVTLYDQGIRLQNGTIRIALDRNVIELRQVVFHGGDGTLTASGNVRLGEADPTLSARIVADRLQLFASPERTLVLSGQATMASEARQLAIRGQFRVDRGLFDLPKASAPVLGDDVVVIRNDDRRRRQLRTESTPVVPESRPTPGFAPVIDLALDLGSNFRFRGAGADLLLAGRLNVDSEPLTPLRVTGTVNVVNGTYEAFGRRLQIVRGVVNFNGPVNNPNLNIRAMRLNQEVEAGVEVTGTVRFPRVRLVSEPNVPDEDKLSWLMFGYGAENAGTAQQQALSGQALGGAALGMLGSRAGKGVAQRFGFDEFSIGPSTAGLTDTQVVSVGKAVTEKITVGYEQGLTSAGNVVKLTWAFSRRWSLLARGGSINGASLLFNRRFSSWSALFSGGPARRDADRRVNESDADRPQGAGPAERADGGEGSGDATPAVEPVRR
ncbi:translocation/assembly module TamB domain-containing protein [Cupriavidus sp. AU9028]|uniref:translocation/assembly module TamB domain-containing protein n=1 Tax=Cupriavidus sp. AU9028 TaxID=2871157 RepID=UPI001C966957|nr:translocation/assembly module TamB domain-containing protein [Cupriavidus sp. AU9028]MBY4899289.1 translocation/assembly module TamB [Cupriavidus sp. AU9028]